MDQASGADLALWASARDGDVEAFVLFYERRFELVVAYFRRRVDEPEVAVDLAAEVFAVALQLVADQERSLPHDPVKWLFGVARNKLADAYRRGTVETQARRALALERLVLDDADIERINQLTNESTVLALVQDLPHDQRQALLARVVDEDTYADVATRLGCSELVARKRVSRALARLRRTMGGS